jgi:hypothetical protein
MTNKEDAVLTISNPRLLSAIYFALLAVIANIIIDNLLYSLGVQKLLPFYQAFLLAACIAAIFGAIFGEKIVHSQKPYNKKVFWWAFLMVIVALPFHTIGFLYFFSGSHPHLFEQNLYNLIEMYIIVLSYSFIFFGLWLAVFAGLAAIYLRGHLVYHILNSLNVQRKKPKKGKEVVKPKTAKHGQATIPTKNNKEDK